MIRRIIEIDKEKCNGCGACADACHEGAIGMVDGKSIADVLDMTINQAVEFFENMPSILSKF